ncbi:PHD finger protein 7 [Cochliomyia hominivorax]
MDICILCKSSKKDDIQYGEFLKNKRFGVHTFCLYLSSNLLQNGEDDKGFLGFLEADIKDEVKRISFLNCCYCRKKYANVGCCDRKCRRTFHFICGLEHNAENQFCSDYRSYCHIHVPKRPERPSAKETCLICYDNIWNPGEKLNMVNIILTPCCRNGWFHKLCLQKFAKTAGYFFKCPLCNDSKIFREKLPSRGIFIPNRDAAWELEPNAFAELLERPSECAAQVCKNKRGRRATNHSNPFVMCSTCGSIAMHRLCLPHGQRRFNCADCTVALEEGDSGRESLNINQDNEDEDIDVCHVSDKEDCDIINRLIGQEGSKRDSGTHEHHSESTVGNDDEEDDIIHRSRIYARNRKITESSSDDSYDNSQAKCSRNDTDPVKELELKEKTSFRTRRITESSEEDVRDKESESDGYIKPCNVTKTRRLESDSDEENDSTDDEIKPRIVRNNRRLKTDSESSSSFSITGLGQDNITRRRITTATTLTNSEKDEEKKESKKIEQRKSSTDEEIVKPFRKRKSSADLFETDDEDDDGTISPKLRCLGDKVQETEKYMENDNDNDNESLITEESDEDDDPLENFQKIVQQQKNISCIALRTRRSLFNKENQKNLTNTKTVANEEKETTNKNDTRGTRKPKFVKLKDETTTNENLDISCIAKRTRRRSMCLNREPEKNLNVIRSRRQTICSDTKNLQKSVYEMSQIYEKVHYSDEERKSTIEEETEPESDKDIDEVDTDVNDFIVNDGYEEKDNNFDISCIANRTRKRKSIKANQKRLILLEEEIEDSSSTTSSYSSTTSTSSLQSSNLYPLNNNNLRKRAQRRLSSDEFDTPEISNNSKTKSISSSYLVEKIPPQNYTAFLKAKCLPKTSTSSKCAAASNHNYHPANHYRPHCNNRKRL